VKYIILCYYFQVIKRKKLQILIFLGKDSRVREYLKLFSMFIISHGSFLVYYLLRFFRKNEKRPQPRVIG
ncbi:hypothetical protein, partial [Enterococcus faecium]|uniref:hypothetical protein n=2 Tax=Enterococcus faecium TaxID=1352 RepID=UPI001F3BB1F3